MDRLPRVARARRRALGERLGVDARRGTPDGSVGARCCGSTATRTTCWRRCCSRPARGPRSSIREAIATLDADTRAELLADLVGERANRRYRPGRGLEALRYRFEIVADYGAFRDLQRHRMLTVQWQSLTPDLGAGHTRAGRARRRGDEYRRALEVSAREYERLVGCGLATAAPYALCLGYRIRFVLDLNAREAMQLIELRSGREGHPSYRAVAHEMHAQISAVHPAVGAHDDPRRPRHRAPPRADPGRDAQPRSRGSRHLSASAARADLTYLTRTGSVWVDAPYAPSG